MGLIHWWPLNGDTQDKIGNIKLTGTFTSNASGKIGSCAQQNSARLTASTTSLTNLKSFSITMWVKFSSTASTAWRDLFGFMMKKGTTTDSMRAEVTSNGGSSFSVFCNSISGSSGGYANFSLSKDVWTHLVFIKDGGTVSTYKNGVLSGTNTLANFVDAYATGEFHIGDSNFYSAYNDVRIFDHVLSQAEVKELSKALVVHYTFDDILMEPTTNIYSGKSFAGHGSSWTALSEEYSGTPVYRNIVTSPNTGNNAGFRYTTTFNYTQSQATAPYITISFWKRLNIVYGRNLGGYIRVRYTDGVVSTHSWSYNKSNWANDSNSIGQWEYITGKASLLSGKTIEAITHLYVYADQAAQGNCDFAGIMVEAKDHATPYTPSSRDSMLRNEAEIIQPTTVSNIVLSVDSASGSYSLKCAGSTYLNHTPLGDASTGATASMWIKDMNTTGQIVVFADANSQLAFGPYGSYCCIGCVNGTNKRRALNVSSLWKAGEWNHVVVRKDSNNTFYCYINGVETTYGATDYWTHSTYLTIGARYSSGYSRQFTGLIDDFRLYYTCLTEDEVQDLYKARALITDKGDIETHQFIEGKAQAQVTSKYCFEADEFYEELYSGYDVLEYIESTGTQYVDTGYVATSTNYTYELDMAPTKIGGFYSYMGFMASGTTPRAGIHEYSNVFMLGANATTNSSTSPVINERIVLKGLFKSGTQRLYKNGTLIASNSTSFNHSANTLSTHIFGRNYSSGRNLTSIKLYSAKIYESSTLVRHYIPVRRQSDNALGLYELLNGTFHANSGSGTFVSGPAITNKSASIYEDMHVSGRELIEI